MYLLGNLLIAVANVLDFLLFTYMIIIIIRALISWVNPDPYNPIVRVLYSITEPVLYPIRRRLPLNIRGIDISPIIVFLAILFIRAFLVQSLHDLGVDLRV
ncbi:YggT family protein [Thermodesulfobacteriota bacterium]